MEIGFDAVPKTRKVAIVLSRQVSLNQEVSSMYLHQKLRAICPMRSQTVHKAWQLRSMIFCMVPVAMRIPNTDSQRCLTSFWLIALIPLNSPISAVKRGPYQEKNEKTPPAKVSVGIGPGNVPAQFE